MFVGFLIENISNLARRALAYSIHERLISRLRKAPKFMLGTPKSLHCKVPFRVSSTLNASCIAGISPRARSSVNTSSSGQRIDRQNSTARTK